MCACPVINVILLHLKVPEAATAEEKLSGLASNLHKLVLAAGVSHFRLAMVV